MGPSSVTITFATIDIHTMEEVQGKILSRASEAGSPTNCPGSDKTRGQGSFGPSTGGPDLQGSLQLTIIKLDNYLDIKFKKKKRTAHLIRLFD